MLTSIFFLLAGVWILIFPPKRINSFYGYRTRNSMKSQSSWNFAQRFSGWEITRWGIILLICSLVGLEYDLGENLETLIGISIFVAVIVMFILRTEQAIKKHTLTEKQSLNK
ncbi:SdpI family protein [Pedobacter mucosus]|uniref:SdpI family protein n=1 Tax=Pedobacter mucosus TaxID=2895286 RepID=UPI001EE4CF0A|nr:SdpI family protein [Pedobacter mucosus]UKT62157.1 SdpI family protein [Pedobacter mucosus]